VAFALPTVASYDSAWKEVYSGISEDQGLMNDEKVLETQLCQKLNGGSSAISKLLLNRSTSDATTVADLIRDVSFELFKDIAIGIRINVFWLISAEARYPISFCVPKCQVRIEFTLK
jgi:hypothetical protein